MVRHPVLSALLVPAMLMPASAPGGPRVPEEAAAVANEIARGCGDGPGRIAPEAVKRVDLTGNGDPDLVIDHAGIACGGKAETGDTEDTGPSRLCLGEDCALVIHLRHGRFLEPEPALEVLASGIEIGEGSPPLLRFERQHGGAWTIRWDGDGLR